MGNSAKLKRLVLILVAFFMLRIDFMHHQLLKKNLNKWNIVVSNRYTSANMGHHGRKINDLEKRDEFLSWLENLEYNFFNIPQPDLTFLLLMPVKLGQLLVDKKGKREYIGGKKRDIYEADINHLINAEESYKYCAKKYVWKIIECSAGNNIKDIRTREEISDEIFDNANKILKLE